MLVLPIVGYCWYYLVFPKHIPIWYLNTCFYYQFGSQWIPRFRPGGSCQSPLLTAKFATLLDGESLEWTTRLQEDESRGREFLSKTGSSFESSWLRWMLVRILWMDIPDIPFLGYSYQVLTNGLEGILSWELCFLLILTLQTWCKHEGNEAVARLGVGPKALCWGAAAAVSSSTSQRRLVLWTHRGALMM